jgi:hypothetical protein
MMQADRAGSMSQNKIRKMRSLLDASVRRSPIKVQQFRSLRSGWQHGSVWGIGRGRVHRWPPCNIESRNRSKSRLDRMVD